VNIDRGDGMHEAKVLRAKATFTFTLE
jgi:hypothetical protein